MVATENQYQLAINIINRVFKQKCIQTLSSRRGVTDKQPLANNVNRNNERLDIVAEVNEENN